MKTNVSTLLREFPKVRRAALSGEDVIVHTREGDLRIIVATARHHQLPLMTKDRLITDSGCVESIW